MSELARRGSRRKLWGSFLFLVLLAGQPVFALSYPITIPFGRSWPLSIAIDSQRGLAYFDASSGDYPPTGFLFGVVNLSSHEVVKVFPLNVVSGPVALDQASGDVYIAGNDSIAVFNFGDQSMGPRIPLGLPLVSMAHDGSVSKDIFVTSGNQVYAIDPATGKVSRAAHVGQGASGLAIDPATGKLYVAEYPDAEIFVFDARSLSPAGVIKLPACCANQMAVDPKTHLLFVTTGTQYVYLVDAATDTFVKAVQVAPSYQNSTNLVSVDGETGRAFVSSSPGGSIVELDRFSGAVVDRFKVASQVSGLAVDVVTHELYATNYHQVTVFDVSRVLPLFPLLALGGGALVIAVVAVYLTFGRRKEQSS